MRTTADNRTLSPAKRGFLGHLVALMTQPYLFYRAFPVSQHWFWVALLVLGVSGFLAVQRTIPAAEPVIGAPVDGGFVPDFGEGGDPFAVPLPNVPIDGEGTTATASDTTSQVTIALIAGGSIVLVWAGQAVFLWLVPLFNGQASSLNKTLQVAVWASVPYLLLMALQWVFRSSGGVGNEAGLSAVLSVWEGYKDISETLQLVIKSVLVQTTLFSLWNVWLLYLGARHALHGKRWVIGFVLSLWLAVAVIVPILSGQINNDAPLDSLSLCENGETVDCLIDPFAPTDPIFDDDVPFDIERPVVPPQDDGATRPKTDGR